MSSCHGWEEVIKQLPVDDETIEMSKLAAANKEKNYYQMTLDECRCYYDQTMLNNGPAAFNGTTTELTVPAEGKDQPAVPLTVYSPAVKKSDKIIIFLHGGGLIFGTVKGYSKVMQRLATQIGAVVVGVEYRLLPDAGDKHAPVNDCVHATKWILANKEKVGGKPESIVGIIGDSSGGQLTLLTCLEVKDGVAFQVPIYPANDMNPNRQSMAQIRDTPLFNGKDMEWIVMHWLKVGVTPDDQKILPAVRSDIGNAPPTMMVVADLDSLRDSVLDLADRMKQAGVKIKVSRYPGVPHGFFGFFDGYPKNAGKLYDEIEKFVNSF